MAYMTQQQIQEAALRYRELVNQGVPAADAYRQAFPNGLPTAEDRAKEAAKGQQKEGLGQLGGLLAGALGTHAVSDLVQGKPVLGGIFDGVFSGGGSAGATEALAAPNLLDVSRVTDGVSSVTGGVSQGTSGIGGSVLPGLGAGLSAYGLYEANQRKNPGAGAAAGAGLAASLALLAGGPITIPLLLGGALGGGGLAAMGKIGDKDRFQEEWKRKRKLVDQGLLPESALGEKPSQGRSKGDLLNRAVSGDFVGYDPSGNWTNNPFSQSRNESDLRPEDVVGFASNYETLGQDYANASLQRRLDFAKQALGEGLYREHHGQLDFTNADRAKQIWQGAAAPIAAQQAQLAPMQSPMPRLGQKLTTALSRNRGMFGRGG